MTAKNRRPEQEPGVRALSDLLRTEVRRAGLVAAIRTGGRRRIRPDSNGGETRTEALARRYAGGDRSRLLRLLVARLDAQGCGDALAQVQAYGATRAAASGYGAQDIEAVVGLTLRTGVSCDSQDLVRRVIRERAALPPPRFEQRIGAVLDVNALVRAMVSPGRGGAFLTWPGPPADQEPAAACLGIFNDARELSLWLSPSLLACVATVQLDALGWDDGQTRDYLRLLLQVADRSGGGLVRPSARLSAGCAWEDARLLEVAIEAGAVLAVSDDQRIAEPAYLCGVAVLSPLELRARVATSRRLSRAREEG